jgi:peptide/nickel transport system substrate-binding protein
MGSRRKQNNRKYAIILIGIIIIIASAGLYYYFTIYMPQYQEKRYNLLTLFTASYPVDLDPALAYDADSNRIIYNIFDRLVKYKQGTNDIEPCLATSWTNPDPLTYIFTLQEDAVFHDGTPFNAESVKYSIERVIDLEGAPSYLFFALNEIEVLDEYEVKITLNFEFAPFLSILAHPAASIVSPTATEELGDDFTKNPVGTGPFILETWSAGNELVLTANRDYFRGAPLLERIIFKIFHESSARKEALEKGEIDVVFRGGILATDISDLENNPDINLLRTVSSHVEFMGFNMLKPPLNDSRIREAIAYAIDYDALINDALGGDFERIGGPIPPTIFGYKEIPLIHRDINRAKQLITEAGYSNGFELTITYNIGAPERRKMAEVIRDSLAEVGITIRIQGLDWDSAVDVYLSMEHELMMNGWIPDYFDPDSFLYPQFHSFSAAPYGTNVFGLADPEIDALIDEGTKTTDPEQRRAIYHEAQDKIVEKMPCIFLAVPSAFDYVRFNVENWVISPQEFVFDAYEIYKK